MTIFNRSAVFAEVRVDPDLGLARLNRFVGAYDGRCSYTRSGYEIHRPLVADVLDDGAGRCTAR
jgi:hypothetical protein